MAIDCFPERPIHAGYELCFTDDQYAIIMEKISHILMPFVTDGTKTEKLMKKKYLHFHREDAESVSDYVARNLVGTRQKKVITAQIHRGTNDHCYAPRKDNAKLDNLEISNWYKSATKKLEGDTVSTDAKTAFVKRMYLSFDTGIIAFVAYIKGKPVYFTLTNNSNLTLQQIKKLFSDVEQRGKKAIDVFDDIVINIDLEIGMCTYIV